MSKKILVVEDEQDIRESVTEALEDAGFEVVTAADGIKGLKAALDEKPDLILLDLVMPGYDGQTVLDKLREDPWGRNAKVIILSSMDDVGNIVNAHYKNIVDYIIKPHNSLAEIVRKTREGLYIE